MWGQNLQVSVTTTKKTDFTFMCRKIVSGHLRIEDKFECNIVLHSCQCEFGICSKQMADETDTDIFTELIDTFTISSIWNKSSIFFFKFAFIHWERIPLVISTFFNVFIATYNHFLLFAVLSTCTEFRFFNISVLATNTTNPYTNATTIQIPDQTNNSEPKPKFPSNFKSGGNSTCFRLPRIAISLNAKKIFNISEMKRKKIH